MENLNIITVLMTMMAGLIGSVGGGIAIFAVIRKSFQKKFVQESKIKTIETAVLFNTESLDEHIKEGKIEHNEARIERQDLKTEMTRVATLVEILVDERK